MDAQSGADSAAASAAAKQQRPAVVAMQKQQQALQNTLRVQIEQLTESYVQLVRACKLTRVPTVSNTAEKPGHLRNDLTQTLSDNLQISLKAARIQAAARELLKMTADLKLSFALANHQETLQRIDQVEDGYKVEIGKTESTLFQLQQEVDETLLELEVHYYGMKFRPT
jgi:selenocysteine lyase/cysteine desulfurase